MTSSRLGIVGVGAALTEGCPLLELRDPEVALRCRPADCKSAIPVHRVGRQSSADYRYQERQVMLLELALPNFPWHPYFLMLRLPDLMERPHRHYRHRCCRRRPNLPPEVRPCLIVQKQKLPL